MTATKEKAYVTSRRVRFGEVDPAGIVYFPRIYDYLHDAFEDLWENHVQKRYYHLLCGEQLGFPLVHSEVDFKHPMHFGDELCFHVTCFKLGDSSIGLRYRILLGETECVEARMTVVCVELESLTSVTIPDVYRVKFQEILEDA